ncbi:MAG: phosphatidylglycerol lysyltransferase domain-containing protein, partial [bacterium]
MLAKFPQFGQLEITDKKNIENITKSFSSYSDFNFVSLYSWDTKGIARISLLNDNLVVRFLDYITNEPFYTFIGKNEIAKTIETILDISEKEGLEPCIKLIPEETVKNNLAQLNNVYTLSEDCDNFDYIYLFEKTVELKGNIYKRERKLINGFKRKYPYCQTKEIELGDRWVQEDFLELLKLWGKQKRKVAEELNNEFIAIKRLFEIAKISNLVNLGFYIGERLIGISINESVNDE